MAVTKDDWQGALSAHMQDDWPEATMALLDVLSLAFMKKFKTLDEARVAAAAFGNLLADGAEDLFGNA